MENVITNVELSKNEMELVCSTEFILTKNRIIEKVYNLFGALSEVYKQILNDYADVLPAELFRSSPKIYRGENYLSLPYIMMDYPRVFLKEDTFAIRSFFWWGNYFSVTLQLSGKYLQQFRNNIYKNIDTEIDDEIFICVNHDMWQHHFNTNNYVLLNEAGKATILHSPFLKMATKLELTEWNNTAGFFEMNYSRLLKLLK